MGNDRLWAVANEILDVAVAAFEAANVDLPDRRFVSNNGVAYDCEQFSVEVGGLSTGTSVSDRPVSSRAPKVPVATVLVALIRDCQPMSNENGAPPSVDAIQEASEELLTDATVLVQTFMKQNALGSCKDLSLQTCVPYGPEGGVAGWVLTIRVVF